MGLKTETNDVAERGAEAARAQQCRLRRQQFVAQPEALLLAHRAEKRQVRERGRQRAFRRKQRVHVRHGQRVQRSGISPARDKSDRVEVSADAKVLADALDAAQKAPAIRTELVQRMREKLNAGELGTDSAKLADRLIDDLLDK